jgi:hypothetical protein
LPFQDGFLGSLGELNPSFAFAVNSIRVASAKIPGEFPGAACRPQKSQVFIHRLNFRCKTRALVAWGGGTIGWLHQRQLERLILSARDALQKASFRTNALKPDSTLNDLTLSGAAECTDFPTSKSAFTSKSGECCPAKRIVPFKKCKKRPIADD